MKNSLSLLLISGTILLAATAATAGDQCDKRTLASPSIAELAVIEGPLDLFVDAVTGVDTLTCGSTPALACRSIQAAIDRLGTVSDIPVTVHIAAGVYEGGIDISSWDTALSMPLHLIGEPGLTTIAATPGRLTGILVEKSSHVILENLIIEGFPQEGIRVLMSAAVEIRSTTLAGNRDGVFLGESDTKIVSILVQGNQRYGVSCEGGWMQLGPDSTGPESIFANNAAIGLRADGCHASFLSRASFSGGAKGMLACNGGMISLNMRSDVLVRTDTGGSGLVACFHGMIEGYANTCTGVCTCVENGYGVCLAESSEPGGGGTRPPRMDLPK